MAGREYVVLSVMVTPTAGRPLMFMLHRPESPITDWGWYEAHALEILDETLPSNWIYSADADGFTLLPASWARPGLLGRSAERRRRSKSPPRLG